MLKPNVPVGPKGHFLLGNLIEFQEDELAFLTRCAQEYGEIVPIRLLHLAAYLLFNPDHIDYVLGTHSRDFVKSRMYELIRSLLGTSLAMNEGDFWLRQRRLMQPAFHRERIEVYGQVMVDYTQRMISTWQDGQTLDIKQAISDLTMANATKTLFNCDVDNDFEGVSEAATEALAEAALRFSTPVPLPENIPTPGNLRYRKAVRRLNEAVTRIIQYRRAHPEDTGDLLSMLLQAHDEDGSVMTDEQLQYESVGMFGGGFATTMVALIWTLYLLSQHPQVEAKLLAELEAVLGTRSPTVADLPKLPYVEMISMEALRLYPPGPLLGREAVNNVQLGGYEFPAGTEFWIVPWVLHRSPKYYRAPDEFRPERWENDFAKRLPKFAYMPFSGGPRVCIGNAFASLEIKLVLATIAQRFHLELAPGHVVEPKFALTLQPKYGMKMVAHRRPIPSAHFATIPLALQVES